MEHDLLMAKLGTTTKKKIKDMKNDLKQKESEKLAQRQEQSEKNIKQIHKKATSLKDSIIRLLKIFGWMFLTLIGVYAPCYLAQLYENSIYSIGANSMNKVEAAHFTNMITFGYNTASIATVLIAYLMLKKLFEIIKTTKHNKKG